MRDHMIRISNAPDDMTLVNDAYDWFTGEYEIYRKLIDRDNLRGRKILDVSVDIPGLSEHVYAQWAELKAIVDILEIRVIAATQKARKFYTEGYAKSLGVQQVERYADADPGVLALVELVVHIKLVLNKWEGLSKGIERLHHQLRTVAEMRRADLEEATI